jgi:hypothetical protein
MPNMNRLFDRLNELLDRVDHIVLAKSDLSIETKYRAYRLIKIEPEGTPVFDKNG